MEKEYQEHEIKPDNILTLAEKYFSWINLQAFIEKLQSADPDLQITDISKEEWSDFFQLFEGEKSILRQQAREHRLSTKKERGIFEGVLDSLVIIHHQADIFGLSRKAQGLKQQIIQSKTNEDQQQLEEKLSGLDTTINRKIKSCSIWQKFLRSMITDPEFNQNPESLSQFINRLRSQMLENSRLYFQSIGITNSQVEAEQFTDGQFLGIYASIVAKQWLEESVPDLALRETTAEEDVDEGIDLIGEVVVDDQVKKVYVQISGIMRGRPNIKIERLKRGHGQFSSEQSYHKQQKFILRVKKKENITDHIEDHQDIVLLWIEIAGLLGDHGEIKDTSGKMPHELQSIASEIRKFLPKLFEGSGNLSPLDNLMLNIQSNNPQEALERWFAQPFGRPTTKAYHHYLVTYEQNNQRLINLTIDYLNDPISIKAQKAIQFLTGIKNNLSETDLKQFQEKIMARLDSNAIGEVYLLEELIRAVNFCFGRVEAVKQLTKSLIRNPELVNRTTRDNLSFYIQLLKSEDDRRDFKQYLTTNFTELEIANLFKEFSPSQQQKIKNMDILPVVS